MFGEKHLAHLHPSLALKVKIPSTTLAMNCPHATMRMLVETRRPRLFAGEDSAMYMGMVVDTRPVNRKQYENHHLYIYNTVTLKP